MASIASISHVPIGTKSQATFLAPLVGTEVDVPALTAGVAAPINGITTFKLVKASGAIAACDGMAVTWTAADQNTVGAVAGAGAAYATVAGIAYITKSGLTGVASGDYFWVAVRGPVNATASAAFAAQTLLATATSGNVSSTVAATDGSTVVARSLAAAAGAGAIVVYATVK